MRKFLIAVGVVLGLTALPSIASAAYAPGHVLVKFDSGVSAARQLSILRSAGATGAGGTIPGIGVHVVPVAGNAASAAARLDSLSGVEFAEVDKVLSISAVPNDPRFAQLDGLNNTGQTGGTPDAD